MITLAARISQHPPPPLPPLQVIKRQGAEGQAMARDAVNIPSIMYEIKRITKT